jgi:hypothetical protein
VMAKMTAEMEVTSLVKPAYKVNESGVSKVFFLHNTIKKERAT